MKKLSEINKNTLLFVAGKKYPEDFFIGIYNKEEFMQSFSEEEAKMVKVFIAEEVDMPCYDLENEIDGMEEMFEGWNERVIDDIGEEEIRRINKIINEAINNNMAYIDGEEVDTTEFKADKKERLKEKVKDRILYHSDKGKYRYELGKAIIDECVADIVEDIIGALEEE